MPGATASERDADRKSGQVLCLTAEQMTALKHTTGPIEITLTGAQLKDIRRMFQAFAGSTARVDPRHVAKDKAPLVIRGNDLLSISSEPVY